MKRYILSLMMLMSSLQINVYGMEQKAADVPDNDDILNAAFHVHYLQQNGQGLQELFQDLRRVPKNTVATTMLKDVNPEEACCVVDKKESGYAWVKKYFGNNTKAAQACYCFKNFVYCDCPRKYRYMTIVQYAFRWFLIRSGDEINRSYIAEELLKYPFDLDQLFYVSVIGRLRITVLHAAVMLDDEKLVEMLVDTKKADPNIKDSEGWTPLQRLAQRNDALHRHGKLLPENEDMNKRHMKMAKALLRAGAKFEERQIGGMFGIWFKKPLLINRELLEQ